LKANLPPFFFTISSEMGSPIPPFWKWSPSFLLNWSALNLNKLNIYSIPIPLPESTIDMIILSWSITASLLISFLLLRSFKLEILSENLPHFSLKVSSFWIFLSRSQSLLLRSFLSFIVVVPLSVYSPNATLLFLLP